MLDAPVERHRILVVDDEPDILASLEDLFMAELPGVKVSCVPSGHDALAALNEGSFDLLISDYKMPGMDGLELLREARSMAPEIPRILMTAFPDLTIAIDAINEASVENFFVKPLDPDDIIAEVKLMLKERAARAMRDRAFARAMELQRRPARPHRATREETHG